MVRLRLIALLAFTMLKTKFRRKCSFRALKHRLKDAWAASKSHGRPCNGDNMSRAKIAPNPHNSSFVSAVPECLPMPSTALNSFWATMNVSHRSLHRKACTGHWKKTLKKTSWRRGTKNLQQFCCSSEERVQENRLELPQQCKCDFWWHLAHQGVPFPDWCWKCN